jgi:hypothetical protein
MIAQFYTANNLIVCPFIQILKKIEDNSLFPLRCSGFVMCIGRYGAMFHNILCNFVLELVRRTFGGRMPHCYYQRYKLISSIRHMTLDFLRQLVRNSILNRGMQ